ncbi:HesA/MoeB/ThiF family protein [Shewanella sp. Scap07]|nr:HesA/MoeB/ThiF family protein [Shewanella sp. Scap07]
MAGGIVLNDSDFIRYSRQIMVPEFGEVGQLKLAQAKVVIIGVGGLGHHLAHSLAASGLGEMILYDGDKVDSSNLPRQLLFNDADIGQFKAAVAANRLGQNYPQTKISAVNEFANDALNHRIDSDCDLLIDCSDNFDTRHWVNRFCVTNDIALLSGSVSHFDGQLSLYHPQLLAKNGCYHCLFPQSMRVSNNCSTTGVLGPMVTMMAALQSLVAIKYLSGIEQPLGVFHRLDGTNLQWRQSQRLADPDCPVCGSLQQKDT